MTKTTKTTKKTPAAKVAARLDRTNTQESIRKIKAENKARAAEAARIEKMRIQIEARAAEQERKALAAEQKKAAKAKPVTPAKAKKAVHAKVAEVENALVAQIEKATGGFEITHAIDPLTGEPWTAEEAPNAKARKAAEALALQKELLAAQPAAKPAKQPKAAKPAKEAKPAKPAKAEGKGATILALVGRKGGATLAEIMTATAWQAHSVRGFLSTANKKGANVASAKNEAGERTYSAQ